MKSGLLSRQAGMMTKSIATLCAATFLLQPIAAIAAGTTSYTYDEARPGSFNAGQLTSVSNAAATIRYDHDERGNVTSQRWEVDGTTYTQTFTYAPHDQVLRRTFADGDVIPSASGTYQYDGAGLLKSIPGLITNISYNANFDPVSTSYGNGVTETRTYDPNRQWLMSITASTGSSTLFEESYTRSTKGLITDVASNRANGDWQYGYDTADRLTSAINLNSSDYTQTFQYDAADNITNNSSVGSYAYPAPTALRPHAVTQAGSHVYSYDSNGNMTSGAGRTIDYDGENRPTSITYNGQIITFVYGPDGARLKKVTGGNTTLYLGADEEITSDGTHIKHPLADVRKSGTDNSWMHRDHLSSVKLMSDAAGAVIAENFYRPYGERSDEQSPVSVPRESKGWIGERDDPETGLTFLNARYYDPVLARFVSPDWLEPQEAGVGTNRFAYASNNPVWLKDPSGNQSIGHNGGPTHDDELRYRDFGGFWSPVGPGDFEPIDILPRGGNFDPLDLSLGFNFIVGAYLTAKNENCRGENCGSAAEGIYSSERSMAEAFPELVGVNPHYRDDAGPGVNTNCVSCVNAAVDRLSGRDPNAVAGSSAGYSDANGLLRSAPFGFKDPTTPEKVASKLLADGNGSIAVLRVLQNSDVEHSIIGVNKGGVVSFIDPQRGSIVTLQPSVTVIPGYK